MPQRDHKLLGGRLAQQQFFVLFEQYTNQRKHCSIIAIDSGNDPFSLVILLLIFLQLQSYSNLQIIASYV